MTTALTDQLLAIRNKRGVLNDEVVVEEATDPSHPLHSQFEWDDQKAGHQYRLVQAQRLLRVTFRPDPTQPTELRSFVAVRGKDAPRSDYVPTEEAMADPFTRRLVLQQMERDWRSFERRYQHMSEFAEFVRRQVEGEAG